MDIKRNQDVNLNVNVAENVIIPCRSHIALL